MFKRLGKLMIIGWLCCLLSGCGALLATALSAAVSYGIYYGISQATKK